MKSQIAQSTKRLKNKKVIPFLRVIHYQEVLQARKIASHSYTLRNYDIRTTKIHTTMELLCICYSVSSQTNYHTTFSLPFYHSFCGNNQSRLKTFSETKQAKKLRKQPILSQTPKKNVLFIPQISLKENSQQVQQPKQFSVKITDSKGLIPSQ